MRGGGDGGYHAVARVVVVGGRVAGSATAMLLARRGYDVIVLERAMFPSDTISTHCVARSGVVQLERWGLLDTVLESGAPAIRQVTFHAAGAPITRTIRATAGVDLLVAPRRHVLDGIVAAAAERAGAEVRHGLTVTGVRRDTHGRVTGVAGHDRAGASLSIGGRFVIGADGLRSSVARLVGAALEEVRPDGGATQYAYYAGIPWPGIEFYVAERSFAGVFPTHGGACIWVCTPAADARTARRRSDSRSDHSPRCSSVAPTTDRAPSRRPADLAGAGLLRQPNQIRRSHGRGWALVGDAGYYRDAITAYGISDAFRDAELLATALDDALCSGADDTDALAAYQRERDRLLREIFEITCQLAAYPPIPRFIELQKQLSAAIDREATRLAAGRVADDFRTRAGAAIRHDGGQGTAEAPGACRPRSPRPTPLPRRHDHDHHRHRDGRRPDAQRR